MADIFEVAEWFLCKKSFTHKQLQKLCYYAQAWHLALLKEPLFAEEFQAWIHGPVSPILYHAYSQYGWQKINRRKEKPPQFPEETLGVLRAVYRTYSKFDGEKLEALTHSETPWQEARAGLKPYESCENVISCQSMENYYAEKYKQAQGD